MEGPPSFEQGGGNREEMAEQELIRRIKEKGPEDPEAREMIIKWIDEQIEKAKPREGELKEPVESIEFNLKMARFYYEIGLKEESLENYNDAIYQAKQQQNEEMIRLIRDEAGRLF